MVNALRQQAAKERAAFFFLDAGDEVRGVMWAGGSATSVQGC